MRDADKLAKERIEKEKRANQSFQEGKVIKDSVGIDRGFGTGETKRFEPPPQ